MNAREIVNDRLTNQVLFGCGKYFEFQPFRKEPVYFTIEYQQTDFYA